MFQEPQPQSSQQPVQDPTALFDVVPKEIPYSGSGFKAASEMLLNEQAIEQASFNAALRSFQETGKYSPELVAFRRSQRLAGLPEPTDAQEMQRYTEMQRVNLASMQKNSPVLFERLKDYENAELLRRDTAAWSMSERIAGATKRGVVEDEYGKLSFKRNYFKLSEDDEKRYQELKKELEILPQSNGNWIAAAGKMLGQMYGMGPENAAWAILGAGVGALGGPGGIGPGFYWGLTTGTAKQTFMTEAGSVVQDMIDQGYDPEAAKTTGLFHGALSSAITAVGFSATTASLRSAVRGVFTPTLLSKLGIDPAKKMLFGNFTTGAAFKRYAGGVLAEDLEEIGQELSAIMAERIAGAISRDEYQSAIQTAQGTQDISERIMAVAVETFQGMALLGLPGLAADVSANNSRLAQAESRAKALTETINIVRGTDAAIHAPDAFADQIAEIAEKQGAEEVILSRKQFDEAVAETENRMRQQNPGINPGDGLLAIRNRFPDLAKQLDEAEKSGADIRLKVADVALMARGEFGLHAEILKRGRIVGEGMDGDTGISWEEAAKQRMVVEQLRAKAVSIEGRRGKKHQDEYERVRSDIERKLKVVPQYTSQQRRFLSQVTADYYAVRAERMSREGATVTISQAYKQDEFTVVGPGTKEQQVKFADTPAPVVDSPAPTVQAQPTETAPVAEAEAQPDEQAAPQAEEQAQPEELVAPESLKFQQDSQRQSVTKQLFEQESAASKTPLSTAAAKRLEGLQGRQEELSKLETTLKAEAERVRGLTREAYLEELEQDLDKAKTLLEGMDQKSDEYKNLLAWAQYTNNYLLQEQAKEQQIEPAAPEVEPEVAPEQAADPVIPTVEQIAEEVLQAAEEETQQAQEQQQDQPQPQPQEQEVAPLEPVDEVSDDPFAGDAVIQAGREFTRLWDEKPRPLNKMFGPNPSTEQKAQHASLMREWEKKRRQAKKRIKEAEAAQQKPAAPAPKMEQAILPFVGKDQFTELQQAAQNLAAGKITRDEWDATVARIKPVKEFAAVPELTSIEDIKKVGKLKKQKINKPEAIKDGQRIALRLDIPSWRDYKTWVVAVHEATKSGSANVRGPIAYTNAVAISNVTFSSRQELSFRIAQGLENKDWAAVANGDKQPMTAEEVQAMAKEVLNSPEWVQVGFNPEIHSYFWDRKTGEPIDKAEMVLQVGPLVLAKNPVYGKKSEKLFSFAGAKAKTANIPLLEEAKARIAANEDKDSVRKDTGWFQGVDGKWRFEIDDSQSSWNPQFEKILSIIDEESGPFSSPQIMLAGVMDAWDLLSKNQWNSSKVYKTGDYTFGYTYKDGEQLTDQQLRAIVKNYGSYVTKGFKKPGTVKLSDVLQHEKLFAAYPQLASIQIEYSPQEAKAGSMASMEGSYKLRIGNIRRNIAGRSGLDERYSDPFVKMLRKLVLHEAQHAIQYLELFAFGSSAKDSSYFRSAGEAEARNVERRIDMTEQERQEQSAESTEDVARDEQIIVINGKPFQAIKAQQPDVLRSRAAASNDAAYLDAVNRGDMKAAQEMVDAAAKAAGLDVVRVYHGTKKEFTSFNPAYRDASKLSYFSYDKEFARSYATGTGGHRTPEPAVVERIEKVKELSKKFFEEQFLPIKAQYGSLDKVPHEKLSAAVDKARDYERSLLDGMTVYQARSEMGIRVLELYLDTGRVFNPRQQWREFLPEILKYLQASSWESLHPDMQQHVKNGNYFIWEAPDIVNAVLEKYDSILLQESTVEQKLDTIAVRDPRRIKSADPVTRDASGNVIPLSQRFQAESPDIRYSRTAEIAGTVDLSTMEITLTKDATFSTFLHEMSHIWLAVLFRDAQSANAPKQIVDDANTLLKWFGLNSFAEWEALPREDRADLHERWAYNFEGFISGEEAPSRELSGIFRMFRRWLTSAWTNIRTRLNLAYREELKQLGKPVQDLPILTTEVAEVMGRLLATDEQIAYNQDFQGLMSLHMTKDQWLALGNTEAEWMEILRLQNNMANDLTDELTEQTIRGMEWLSSKNVRMLKEHKAKIDAQRKKLEKQFMPELIKKRVHQARKLIQAGELLNPDGSVKLTMSESRLNLNMVREMFADDPKLQARVEAELRTGKAGMLFSKGVDPSQLADVLGYPDAKSMVMEILNAPSLEEDMTTLVDAEMKSKYKDMMDPKKIQKQISAQLAGKMRQKMVAIELRGLDRNLRSESDAGQPQLIAQMEQAQTQLETLLNDEKSIRDERDALKKTEMDIRKEITKEKRKANPDQDKIAALSTSLEATKNANMGRITEINSSLKDLNKQIRKAERLAEGPKTTVATILRAAQEVAIELMGKTLVKDALPSIYETNARMRRRGTTIALARGESLVAIEQKRGELTQAAMAEQATAFQQEMDSFKEFVQGMFRMSRKDMAKGRDYNMAVAARGVAAAFGFGTEKQAETVVEAVKAMRVYAPELAADVETLLSEANQQATKISQQAQARGAAAGRSKRNRAGPLYRELTVEQMQQLMDRVKGLWKRASEERQVELGGVQRTVDEAADLLRAKVMERMGGKPVGAANSASGIMSYLALSTRAEHLMEHLDGQQVGEWQLMVYRWVKDNAVKARGEFAQKLKQLSSILADIDMRHGEKIVATELGGHVFGEDPDNALIQELMHVILHMGNPENLKKMVMGKTRRDNPQAYWGKIDEEGNLDTTDLRKFIERMIQEKVLTEQHFRAAEKIFALMDELTPGALKAYYRVNGYNMKLVKHGQIVNSLGTFRGGYVPSQVDKDATPIGDMMDLKAQMNEQFSNGMPKARDGFTKERVDKGGLPRVLNVNSLAMHIRDVLFYTHLQPVMHDLSKVLTQEDLANALKAYDPAIMRNVLIPWMGRTVRQLTQTPTNNPLDKIARKIRRNVGLDKLALNFNVMFQQFTGLSVSATRVPKRQLAKALAIWTKNPLAAREFIAGLSPAMVERFANQMTEMMNKLEEVIKSPNAYKNFRKWAMENGMVLQAGAQNIVDSITWIGAFNEFMETKGRGLSIDEAQKQAASNADSIVRITQGGGFAEDLSTSEAGTVWAQLFMQFQTVFIVMVNAAGWKARTLIQDMGMMRASPRVLSLAFFGLYVPLALGNLISEAMRGELGDDEDMDGVSETWFRTLVMAPLTGTASGLPQVGYLINFGLNRLDNKRYNDKMGSTPVFGAFEAAVRGISGAYNIITDPSRELRGQDIKDWATFIATMTGIPVSVLAKPASYYLDESRGFYNPDNLGGYIRGMATGTGIPANR